MSLEILCNCPLFSALDEQQLVAAATNMRRQINYLIGECERCNTTRLTLPEPEQVIASRLGITPETFSRLVQRLRNAGLLELRGAELAVKDRDALQAYRHEN